jgi:choline-sulfatase
MWVRRWDEAGRRAIQTIETLSSLAEAACGPREFMTPFIRPTKPLVLLAAGVLLAALAAGVMVGAIRANRGGDTSAEPSPEPTAARPHVILVTIDTLRADRVQPGGPLASLTPALNALAARGVRFTDATSHAPLTFPSHVSILTGRLPSEHGARDNGSFVLKDEAVTLAERLKDAGYRTGAFVASFVLARSFGLAQGFEEYNDRLQSSGARYSFSDLQRRGSAVAGDAAAWLRKVTPSGQPVFLWMHLYDPHTPYEAPAAFAERFPGTPYNAEVAAADWAVDYLLRSAGDAFLQSTVVVVTSDHGESLGEHGEPEHGIFLYDSTLSVPLVMAGPGLPAGRVVTEQVRHIDLMPTILELATLRGPDGNSSLPGESLVPLANGARRQDVPPSYAESWYQRLHFGWSELRSVRTPEWKYVSAPREELYDLQKDRAEQENVAAAREALAGRLRSELDRLTTSAGSPIAAEQRVDSATAERLRSLGYLGGGGGAVGSTATGDDPKDRIDDYVRFVAAFYAALEHLEAGAFAKAVNGFGELARSHPYSFEAHQYLGRALAANGKRAESLAEYEVAIGLNPGFASTYFDAARVEAAMGRFPAARERVRKGLAIEPESFYGHFVSGLVEQSASDATAARAAFERAVALNPGLAPAHYELGALAERRGDVAAARDHYRRALDADVTFDAARRAIDRLGSATSVQPPAPRSR